MRIDFFQNELCKVQDRFNETFGKLVVCNVSQRQRIMLSIISMGRLEKKIMAAGSMDNARDDIKKFVRTRNILNKEFDKVEEFFNERREHATANKRNADDGRRVHG